MGLNIAAIFGMMIGWKRFGTWPVRFDGVPTKVEPAPLLGAHTTEVLSDWLGLDAAAVAQLRQDGIV